MSGLGTKLSHCKTICLAAAPLSFLLFISMGSQLACHGSDWVEDDSSGASKAPKMQAKSSERPAPLEMPVPAPDFRLNRQGKRGGGGSSENGSGNDSALPLPESAGNRNKSLELPGSGGTHVLQGSASTFDATSGVMRQPRYSPSQANLGSDAESFLLGAQKNASLPPHMLKAWLDRTHPEFRLTAQDNPDAIVEVKGQWDDASKILTALSLRYHHVKARELTSMPLTATRVLVLNCEGRVPKEAVESIRQWVIRGGYLISTDWTLGSFVERAFPGFIAWNGQSTDGTVVDALVTADDPELYAGAPVRRSTWKLDQMSQMVRVLKPQSVRVLARSYKLAADDRNRQYTPDPNYWGVLAVEFPYGRGHVLHLVGHFDYNSPLARSWVMPDPVPGIGLSLRQVLSTNFLIKGLTSTEHKDSAVQP